MTDEVELEPEVPETDGRKRRSFSQLSSYISCSEAFRLERIIRPRPAKRPAAWFTLGLGIHKALEQWEESARTSDLIADFTAEFERVKAEQLAEQPDLNLWNNPYRGKNVYQALDAAYEKGVAQLETFKSWIQDHEFLPMIDPENGDVWVEVPFEIELGRVPVIGFIDFVEAGGMPVDYKSGDKKNSRDLQLGLYRVALEEQYGIESKTGQFFYTKIDGRSPFGPSEHIDTTRYTKQYLTDLFEAMESGIENNVFIPNPGSGMCGICSVADLCREKGSRPVPMDWESIPEDERWWGAPIDGSA